MTEALKSDGYDMSTERIEIYCDGACRGNNTTNTSSRIGAYAYKLTYKGKVKLGGQAEKNTTNNIMELKAVIEALKALKPSAKEMSIDIFSDSNYVVSGLNSWWDGWVKKGFSGVKNVELWKELKVLFDSFPHIKITWVKGHSGNQGNEDVDAYCNALMDCFGR